MSSRSGVGCGGWLFVIILVAAVYWLYTRGAVTTDGAVAYITSVFTTAYQQLVAFFQGFAAQK